MAEKAKSMIEIIKDKINNAGQGSQDMFYVKKDGKRRIRFLTDGDEVQKVIFHSIWKQFNHPCLKQYNKECPNCKNDEAKNDELFVFTVYNYETQKRELFCYKANKCSPLPGIVSMFEQYNTLCDRDYVIQRMGEGTATTYTVMGLDKKSFKGDEVPFTEREVLKILLKANPPEKVEDDSEDEDDKPVKKKVDVNVEYEEAMPDFDKMNNSELKAFAKKNKIKIPTGITRKEVIELFEDSDLPF